MTNAELSAYLDAHGVPGAPTEEGWCVVMFSGAPVVLCVYAEPFGLSYRVGSRHVGSFLYRTDITRHAQLILAAPPGRDLDAEVVAGVQAQRKEGE